MASTAKKLAPVAPAKPVISTTASPKPAAKKSSPKLSIVTNKPAAPKADPRFAAAAAALEWSRSATMICDANWNITFSNKQSQDTFAALEPTLHAFHPSWKSFNTASVVGSNLSFLFVDEPHQWRQVTDIRNQSYETQFKVGPAVLDFHVAPIVSSNGTVTAYAVDWNDITAQLEAERRHTQLLTALDVSNTNVMLSDADLKLTYINQTLQKNLKGWEPELQKAFGMGFKSDQLMGRCIDEFHKNPQHQRRILGNESSFPMQTMIEVGPLKLELAINILKGKDGSVLGFSTEWTDATELLRADAEYKDQVKTIADRMDFLRGACSTDLAVAMQALADGDLTVTLVPKTPLLDIPPQPDLAVMANTFNELRNQTVKSVEAYNNAQAALSNMIAETLQTADSIAKSSNEVSVGNDDLAQRTEEQASSLEETASSMEEMTSTVKQNADNAKQANQLALQARESAEKGGIVVGNAVSTMAEINTASKRIADIISVIDEIAFQTNLLALNAAVEAARVGEQGRGFAVVAGEVRNLAGRSATAAKEIKTLVQDSVQKVQDGSNLVNQSGQQLEEIVNSVKKVADIISEISAAAQEQSEGIEQVNKAIIQMDQITQQNAALVEEASATSQSMNQQAESLQELVGKFRVDPSILAKHSIAAPSHAPAPRATTRPVTTVTARASVRAAKKGSADEFEEF